MSFRLTIVIVSHNAGSGIVERLRGGAKFQIFCEKYRCFNTKIKEVQKLETKLVIW